MLLKLGLILLIRFGFIASVYVPNESTSKSVYTAGIKTTNWKSSQPIIHQNYSKTNFQQHSNSKNLDEIYENNRAGKYINQNFDQQVENVGQQIENFDQQQIDDTQKLTSFNQNFGQHVHHSPKKHQHSHFAHYHQSSNFNPKNYYSGQTIHQTSQNQGNTQPISECPPGETGQFVYEYSCNQFLNCWKGRGVPQNCPPGTLFNPSTLECDYASKVRCVTGPRNLPSGSVSDKEQAHCPPAFSGIIPYYKNCSKFINCDNGKENIMDCPPGTLFSVKNNLCDFPYKVECVNDDGDRGENCGPGGCHGGHGHYEHQGRYDGQYRGESQHRGHNSGQSTRWNQGRRYDDGQYHGAHHNHGQYSGGNQGGRFDDGQYRGEHHNHGQNSGQYSGGNQGGGFDDGQYRGEHHNHRQSSGQYSGGNQGRGFDDGQYRGEHHNHGQSSGQYSGGNQGRGFDNGQYREEHHNTGGRYDDGQYREEHHGQNSGQYYSGSKGSFHNVGQSQTGQNSQKVTQIFGGQTSSSHLTHQPSTIQQKGTASSSYTSQGQRPKCPPGKTGLVKHPTICAKFLNCMNGNTFIQDCGPGTVFNPKISACDFPYNVDCKNLQEETSGSSSGTNSGSYSGSNSVAHSGTNSGQGSQSSTNSGSRWQSGSYSGSNSGAQTDSNSGRGWQSGSNSGSYSGSNFGQESQSGSYSGSNSKAYTGKGPQSGSYSGSNSGAYSGQGSQSGSYSGSNSGAYSGQGSQSGSNSGSYSGSNSESAFGQGHNSGWHSGQIYRPESGHSGSYHGQNPSGFIGASGQGQNLTKPGFSTNYNGKYSSSNQGQTSSGGNQGFINRGKNGHTYGQRPQEEEVGNEPELDGSSEEHFGHNHQHQHQHNHTEFGHNHHHHHHHNHSNFDGRGFGNHHRLHHNHSNFDGPNHGQHHQHQHGSNFNVQTVDNQNFYQVTENPEQSTSKTFKSKHWPPPFPSTDVNADYVFEYEDFNTFDGVVRGSKVVENWCDSKGFECGNKVCVAPSKVCDGKKECPNGRDEVDCFEYFSDFYKIGGTKLAVKEMEKTSNITCLWCSKMCGLNKKCKAFNYRPMDGTCYLLNSNVGLSGALILLENYDYYESKNYTVDCSKGYECRNKKCISKEQVCDGINDCGDRMDEKGCKAEAFAYSLHLVGGPNKHSGNLEVHAFNKKGYICDDMFGLRNADVACRELGFPLGALETKGNSFFVPNANTSFYMMDDITCLGNETSLRDCDFNGWGVNNCGPLESVGVICKTPQEVCPEDSWPCDSGNECLQRSYLCDGVFDCSDESDESSKYCEAPIKIRLVNGSSSENGRVEIKYKGVWGTICDDDFNDDAAKIVCKELGFKGSAYAKKDGFYGPGSGPIWLDQVFCGGNEESVANCTHWDWGEHNCDHGEDVGVICSNYDISGKPRHINVDPVPLKPKGPILPKQCGMRSDDMFREPSDVHFRVVRGSLAQQGHYPWQASIRVKGKTRPTHWCGAVVISSSFVLTAAHCLIGFSKGAYYVVAGDYNVDTPEGTEQEAFIEDFIIHENFRVGTKMNNDIALVKLKGRGFELTKDVQAICLPEAETTYERRNCTISGFGSIESGKSRSSKDLRAGWLPILPIEVCKMPHIYGESITPGMFCAGSLDEGVDACDGDSGGPFACLKDGVFTLYGITSWGQHCGYANKPGVYVKVAHYREWIDNTLQKLINN